jgi:hypothetical protein
MTTPRLRVEFQATRPDGCVSLELNEVRADVERAGIALQEGMLLSVWQPCGAGQHEAVGVVHYDEDWGWGVRVDAALLATFQP